MYDNDDLTGGVAMAIRVYREDLDIKMEQFGLVKGGRLRQINKLKDSNGSIIFKSSMFNYLSSNSCYWLDESYDSTHTFAIKSISDNTIFFYKGAICEQGPTKELFTNPRQSKTMDYILGR